MAGTQYRGANRSNAHHLQSSSGSTSTTIQSQHHLQQYGTTIFGGGTSTNNGNGSHANIGTISTITTASSNPSHGILESQMLQQPQHVEIVLNDDNDDAEQIAADREAAGEQPVKKVRHRRHKRPFYRRVFNYIRTAWTGVNFSSSNDSELEELETTPRYRPDSLSALSRSTRFSEAEIKRIYRGFKAECPTVVVKEDTFKIIYSQFFPQGANTGLYAHYVFNTLDSDHSGIVSFEKMDLNRDGVVTLDEFLECCRNDDTISRSMAVFDSSL